MSKLITAIILALVVGAARLPGETLPEAPSFYSTMTHGPRDNKFTKLDNFLTLGELIVRTNDTLSTRHALTNGGKEDVLPQFVADHAVTMEITGVLVTAATRYISVRHRKIGRVLQIVDIVSTGYCSSRNWVGNGDGATRRAELRMAEAR